MTGRPAMHTEVVTVKAGRTRAESRCLRSADVRRRLFADEGWQTRACWVSSGSVPRLVVGRGLPAAASSLAPREAGVARSLFSPRGSQRNSSPLPVAPVLPIHSRSSGRRTGPCAVFLMTLHRHQLKIEG
jgi:hypothetical protein